MMAETLKLVSGGDDIKLWEPPNLRLCQTFKPHSQAISSLAWSPNNNFLASTAPGDPVVVTTFKGSSPNSIELPGCEEETCVTFNSTSRHLLTGGTSKVLNLWDLKTRTVKKKIKIAKDTVNCVTFNWNDTNIASGTTGGDIYIHSVSTTQTSPPLRLPKTQAVHAIKYSKFKKAMLGSVSDDGCMNIWDTNTKKILKSFLDQHSAPAMDIAFSPMNDMLVASAGLDKKIIFYDVQGKKVIKEMSAESPLCSISFMQDGAAFGVGSTRGEYYEIFCEIWTCFLNILFVFVAGKIYIYDLRSGSTPLHSTQAHKSAVHRLSFQLQSKSSANTSSSSTLAEKFTSRLTADSSKPATPSHNGEHEVPGPMKRQAPPEPVQNGLKTNEESGIFSPLRDGSTVSSTVVKTELNQSGTPTTASSKRTDNVQVSGIFSPIYTSTSSYQSAASAIQTDTFVTSTAHEQNGYSAAAPKDNVPQVTRQPLTLTTSTSYSVRPTSSLTTHSDVTGNLPSDKVDFHEEIDKKITLNKNKEKRSSMKSPPPGSSSQMQVENDRGSTMMKAQEREDLALHSSDEKSSNLTASREVLNGFLQSSQTNSTDSSPGFQQFQVQFIKNLIDDSLDELRINFHRDIVNLQVEMLRQFQIQQNEMRTLLQQYSLNESLVKENEKLREEIKRLRTTH